MAVGRATRQPMCARAQLLLSHPLLATSVSPSVARLFPLLSSPSVSLSLSWTLACDASPVDLQEASASLPGGRLLGTRLKPSTLSPETECDLLSPRFLVTDVQLQERRQEEEQEGRSEFAFFLSFPHVHLHALLIGK